MPNKTKWFCNIYFILFLMCGRPHIWKKTRIKRNFATAFYFFYFFLFCFTIDVRTVLKMPTCKVTTLKTLEWKTQGQNLTNQVNLYTVHSESKKHNTKLLPITSPNVNRFFEILSLTDSLINLQQTHISILNMSRVKYECQ